MRKSQAVEIVARRLRLPHGRLESIAISLADAGVIEKTSGSRRYPGHISINDVVSILLGGLVDQGIGAAPAMVRTFGTLNDAHGTTLRDVLTTILERSAVTPSGALIVRHDPPSASLTVDGVHMVFGEPADGTSTTATLVPPGALTAIALELSGASPEEADALLALARVSAAASLTRKVSA